MKKSDLLKQISHPNTWGYNAVKECVDNAEDVSDVWANLNNLRDDIKKALELMRDDEGVTELTD